MNPGIIKTVEFLQSHGFRTTDSGDGKTHDYECDLPIPYVHMQCSPNQVISEADRLFQLCLSNGIEVGCMGEAGNGPNIQVTYNPFEAYATISLFDVIL